jgi:hypothetical protein
MAEERYEDLERPEQIRQQMEETRTSLAEKLETLEQKVTTTVQETATAVTDTVETVKKTVASSVENVKETLNPRLQTELHPWGMVGGAFALGFLGGWVSGGGPQPSQPVHTPQMSNGWHATPLHEAQGGISSHLSSWLSEFRPEIEKLKGLAISAAAGIVRDALADAVPENLRPHVTELIDNVATRFGGEPRRFRLVEGPVARGCRPPDHG